MYEAAIKQFIIWLYCITFRKWNVWAASVGRGNVRLFSPDKQRERNFCKHCARHYCITKPTPIHCHICRPIMFSMYTKRQMDFISIIKLMTPFWYYTAILYIKWIFKRLLWYFNSIVLWWCGAQKMSQYCQATFDNICYRLYSACWTGLNKIKLTWIFFLS